MNNWQTEFAGPIAREASFGPFRIIPERRLLLCGDERVRLGEPAYNVLLALIEHAGETIERETLLARVWGSTYIGESNLRTAVAALRRALKAPGFARPCIATVTRGGYCFVEPVVFGEPTVGQHGGQTHLTKIVGRDSFVTDLVEAISRYRLITVVGCGGIGKTNAQFAARRALRVAAAIDKAVYHATDIGYETFRFASSICSSSATRSGKPARKTDTVQDSQRSAILAERRDDE